MYTRSTCLAMLLIGFVLGSTATVGVRHVQERALEQTLVNMATSFVQAEYSRDTATMLELASHRMASEIRTGIFPDLVIKEGVDLSNSRMMRKCNDQASVLMTVQPKDGSRYFLEEIQLILEAGGWGVNKNARSQ